MYPLGCWCLHLTPSFFRHKVWTEDKEECIKVNKKTNPTQSPATDSLIYISPNEPQTPQTIGTSATSGKTTNFVEKTRSRMVLFFFTYERCRRRRPLIKMINGAEEVFVLLSPRWITNICFESIVLRVSKVRLFIREKIRFVSKRHDKKKDGKPKISGEKMFQQKCLGFLNIRV